MAASKPETYVQRLQSTFLHTVVFEANQVPSRLLCLERHRTTAMAGLL